MSPVSTRICVPNLVVVRRSCRKKGGGYRQTDKGTLQLYIVDCNWDACLVFCLAQTAAKMIKDTMDKKFGASWHVVVGEGFGFEMTHEIKNMMYMFFAGTTAILLWKCS